jgi:glycosyltransferase involved in cell wall biosynthesis
MNAKSNDADRNPVNSAFAEHFRCPNSVVEIRTISPSAKGEGYFRFGQDLICYGAADAVTTVPNVEHHIPDISPSIKVRPSEVEIPFDLDQIVGNLRNEYYAGLVKERATQLPPNPIVRNLYYLARPMMSVGFRKILQRVRLRGKASTPFPHWPVDRTVDRLFERLMILAIQSREGRPIPLIWFWPDGAPAALILTHDVETETGRDFCGTLMDIDDSFGFKSSFQVIPEKRYEVTDAFLETMRQRGFEVNVHDLNHDGNLFRARDEFLIRAKKINEYTKRFGTTGFRSGGLYRNLRWYDAFEFSYDMSVPNVAHLDPQGGGCCTLFPYFVFSLLEIPVTATQDYSLFHILDTYSIDLWKQQCELILQGHGMISIIVHPDYVIEGDPQEAYKRLLSFLKDFRSANNIWAALPGDVDRWWRQRNAMRLVKEGDAWKIEGQGNERARIAYAHLKNGQLVYSFDPTDPDLQIVGSNSNKSSPASVEVSPKAFTTPSAMPAREHFGTTSTISDASPIRQTHSDTNKNIFAATALPEPADAVIDVSVHDLPSNRTRTPLRVCMVSYSFYERDNRVMRYAETLARRGDSVDVLALQRENGLPRMETINGVHLIRLQSRKMNEKNRFSYLGRILQFLLRATYQVAKNHLEHKYDFIHVHSVPDFIVFSALLPKLSGTPIILDIHDILPEFYTSKFGSSAKSLSFRLLRIVEKLSTKFADHVIIANHIWQERLVSRSVPIEKCTVVLNCPDRSIFHRNGHAREVTDRFVLLYPGTLNAHQGLELAIRAFGKISELAPHADFHIYGDGPSKDELTALIAKLGLQNRVFIRNPVQLRQIPEVIEAADLGIVPKLKNSFGNEAFSTKILEFMAMDVPVIVSDTQIDRYYFDDSVVRFFRGGDERDLADSMLEMINNPDKRELLVLNASEYVKTVDWTAKRHEYLELVDQLVANRR